MKFLFFIASIMLIVLINQHSTMGAPVDDSSVEEQCPEGMERDKKGVCRKSSPVLTITQRMVVLKKDPEIKDGGCPEGMVHGKHGICHEAQPTETTTVREEKLEDCAEGEKRDEQGVCQLIKTTNSENVTSEPQALRKERKTCPLGFAKYQSGCLAIKATSTLRSAVLDDKKPKSGDGENALFKTVAMLPDKTCPKGTEYSGPGLCQKRISSSSDSKCPAGSRLVNDKCMPTNSSEQDQSSEASSSTSTLSDQSESTTLADESTSERKPKTGASEESTSERKPKTGASEESTTELPSETTPTSDSSIETAAVKKPKSNRRIKTETTTVNE